MKGDQVSQKRTFKNSCEFADRFPELYPQDSYAFQLVTNLKGIVVELSDLTASQKSGIASTRATAAAKGNTRDELSSGVTAIAKAASAMVVTHPEVLGKFQVPRRITDDNLVDTALTFSKDAAPLTDLFVKFGMAPTFIEDLASKMKAFQDASQHHANTQKAHTVVTKSLDETIEKGRLIMQQLDPLTRNRLQGNTFMLDQWSQARRVVFKRGSRVSKVAAQNGATEKPEETPTT